MAIRGCLEAKNGQLSYLSSLISTMEESKCPGFLYVIQTVLYIVQKFDTWLNIIFGFAGHNLTYLLKNIRPKYLYSHYKRFLRAAVVTS